MFFQYFDSCIVIVVQVDFVMKKLQIKNAGDVLMIGDRLDTDIEFANVRNTSSSWVGSTETLTYPLRQSLTYILPFYTHLLSYTSQVSGFSSALVLSGCTSATQGRHPLNTPSRSTLSSHATMTHQHTP